MNREYHRWHSPTLGRDMELLVFGHAGARVLAFPTSRGRFYEWEDRGLIRSLAHHIHSGWLQIICVDSIDSDSWYAYHHHPGHRAWMHELYDRYLSHEVVPFTRWKNPNPFLIATGASFGAYHALNFGLRHPDAVGRIISLSGLCDIRRFLHGYFDNTVYHNNPVDFVAGEHDPHRLALLQRQDVVLAVGREDAMFGSNQHLSDVLWGKGIWHAFRPWDGWYHDWPHWEKMLHLYIGGHD
jgi:esterase/lipase superfamily enzyme